MTGTASTRPSGAGRDFDDTGAVIPEEPLGNGARPDRISDSRRDGAIRSVRQFLTFMARDPWWGFVLVCVETLLHLCFRWRLIEVENIPECGPAIVASNHVSPIDPFAIGLATTARRRSIRYLAAAEFFDPPLSGFMLRRLRMIPIRRGDGDLGALDAAVEVLRGGDLVGIFPEGGLGDGVTLHRGHSGVGRLALQTGLPVVPVAVWGTQRRWPRSGMRVDRPVRPKASVVVGRPIHPKGDPASPQDVRRLTDEVMKAIAAGLAAARSVS